MKGHFSRCAAAFLVAATVAGAANGALIVFNGQNSDSSNQTGSPPFSANSVAAGVTATGLIRNAGTLGNNGINSFGVDNLPANHSTAPYYRSTTFADEDNAVGDNGGGSPQQAEALANDAYISFTISATSPTDVLSLVDLTYDISQGTGSANQERGYAFYSSLDNYASALAADATLDALRPNWVNGSVSLGNVQASSVTFRLYLFVGDGAGTGSNIDFDNIQVNGSVVAVPEPASTILAIAAVAVGAFRSSARRFAQRGVAAKA
jgi:hypothetical protein